MKIISLEEKAVMYFGNVVCVEEWANYIATNENGTINCFHQEPRLMECFDGMRWKSVNCRYMTSGIVGKGDGVGYENSLWKIEESEIIRTTDQLKEIS